MCAKDDLVGRKGPLLTSTQMWEVLFQTHNRRLAGELATAESVTAKDSNHVDTFGSDFAFSFAAWLQRIKCTLGDVDSLFADNILSLIAFIISHRLFADKLNIQQSLLDRATVVLIIILVDKTQLLLILGDVAAYTLLAGFIPTTKIRDLLLKTLENAAKSRILLACADRRTRQCYPTICAILADYEEQVLLTGVKKNRYCTRCTRCLDKGHDDFVYLVDCFGWKHYNFNIYVSLATDTLHLLLKGLVMKMLDFMQDMLDDIYPGSRKTWDNSTTLRFRQVMHSTGLKRFNNKRAFTELVAVVSLLFVSKAPFALHFIRAVCDLVTLAQYKSHDEDTLAYIQGALERMNVFKEEFRVYRRTLGEEKNFNYPKWHALTHIIQDIRMYGALDGICTRANSEAHYITIVKQFYSITNKKEYILQICLHNSRRTALLAADHATVVKQNRTYSTRVTRPLLFRRLGWLIPGIQPYLTKLPLSEVAANIAISDFIYAAAVFDRLDVDLSWVGRMSVQIHSSIKCWRSSGKRHNDSEHCDEEVLYLILTIIDHTCYDKDRKHMAYIGAFSEVLLFNNNRQIDNTTRMLSVRRRAWNAAPKRRTLQAFKFYDLSTIIRLVHLVPRDLPDLTTRTTMSYYVNNYIN
ncbi:hypothetical protein HBI38_177430 [Parastagonospora nodorum]|nr:hypothetical protein HBI40_158890 [Parastagonospora nodorum]KAH6310046.1 hypothetical protein HBI38_177430 [Parastagonospora nodorum]